MNAPVTSERTAMLAAGLVAVMWGMAGVFVRLLPPASPVAITAGRLLVALLVSIPIIAFSAKNRRSLMSSLGRPAAYILALLLAGYYFLATIAFQLSPVAEVALFLSTPPLFVLTFRRLHGDSPLRAEVVGAVVAIVGIMLILAPNIINSTDSGYDRIIGDLLAFASAGLSGLYVYIYRNLAETHNAPDPVGVTFMTFLLGGVILGVIILSLQIPTGMLYSGNNLLAILGLGIFSTAISSTVFAIASKHLPAVVTATILLLIPVFAGIFAYLILGEKLSPLMIPGGVLVLSGIAMILNLKRKKA